MTPTRFFRVIGGLSRPSIGLKLAEVLHLERRYRADDARGERQCSRHDPTSLHRGLERAAPYLGAQWLKQSVTRLGHAARHHHDVRIKNVEQVRHTGPENASRLADHLSGRRVASLRRFVDRLRGDLSQIAVHHAHQDRHALVAPQRFASALGDRRPRRVGLEASIVAALAAPSGRVDRCVTDLARHVGRSVIQLALENQSAADAGAEGHADDVPTTDRGAAPELAERGAIRVVIEGRLELDATGYLVAQRKILPPEVRRYYHQPFLAIERARGADADAQKVRSLRAGFLHFLRDDFLHHRCDPVHHRSRATLGQCWRGMHRDLPAAIHWHRAGNDVGAAKIYSNDVTLLRTHTGTGGLRTSVNKLEM